MPGRFDLTKDLDRGGRFDFTKDDGGIYSKIQVELTWKTDADLDADLDACAFLLGEDGIILRDEDFIYFKSNSRWMPKLPLDNPNCDVTDGNFEPFDIKKHRNKKRWRKATIPVSADGSVLGSPDDRGDDHKGDASSETMYVLIDKISDDIQEIVFGIAIATPGLTFSKVQDPAILITDVETGNVLCRYNLKNDFGTKTAVEVGKILRDEEGVWQFEAIAEGHDGGIETLADIYV